MSDSRSVYLHNIVQVQHFEAYSIKRSKPSKTYRKLHNALLLAQYLLPKFSLIILWFSNNDNAVYTEL